MASSQGQQLTKQKSETDGQGPQLHPHNWVSSMWTPRTDQSQQKFLLSFSGFCHNSYEKPLEKQLKFLFPFPGNLFYSGMFSYSSSVSLNKVHFCFTHSCVSMSLDIIHVRQRTWDPWSRVDFPWPLSVQCPKCLNYAHLGQKTPCHSQGTVSPCSNGKYFMKPSVR